MLCYFFCIHEIFGSVAPYVEGGDYRYLGGYETPASCGNFASSCIHSQNRQIFPDLAAVKKSNSQ